MRLALAQIKTNPDKTENLNKILKYINEAANEKCDVVAFPEMSMALLKPNATKEQALGIAEQLNGHFVSKLSEEARRMGINVLTGLIEKGDQETLFNTIVLISSNGRLLHRYRKSHLFDAFDFSESIVYTAGDEAPKVVITDFGKVGIITCYEIRFPEMTRILALGGAEITFIPSAWMAGVTKEEQWLTLAKARALENTFYVACPVQIGNFFSGRSVIVDPLGLIIADAGEREKLLITEIDMKERINEVRRILPCLSRRREDIYRKGSSLCFDELD